MNFLTEQVKKHSAKLTTVYHVNLIAELILNSKKGIEEIITVLAPQYRTMLAGENTKTVANYPIILALTVFFIAAQSYTKNVSHLHWIVSNDSLINYLCSTKGFINTPTFFVRNPSL
jgi:hypothetical protein